MSIWLVLNIQHLFVICYTLPVILKLPRIVSDKYYDTFEIDTADLTADLCRARDIGIGCRMLYPDCYMFYAISDRGVLAIRLSIVASISMMCLTLTVMFGPEDVYDGNQKLILGLVWTLIKTYQIKSSGKKVSTKKAMLAWINIQIPMYRITNFTSDWNNGKAICGLVDQIKLGVCSDHMGLDKSNGLENCILGMDLAEKHLKVPQIVSPADINNPMIDELSVMTYISYYFGPANERLMKWLQEKLPEKKITNFTTDWNDGTNLALLINRIYHDLAADFADYKKENAVENCKRIFQIAEDNLGISCLVSAKEFTNPEIDEIVVACLLWSIKLSDRKAKGLRMTGEIVEEGAVVRVGEECKFFVSGAKNVREVKITIQGPSKDPVVKIQPFDANSVAVKFTPPDQGNYTVFGLYTGANIPGSPYTIQAADPSKLQLLGQVPTALQVKESDEIFFKSYGVGPGHLIAKSSQGRILDADFIDAESGSTFLKLHPKEVGDIKVNVTWSGLSIPQSPFKFSVCDASKASAYGRHLSTKEGKVGEPFEMTVQGRYAGNVHPRIVAKGATTTPHVELEELSQGTFKAQFIPYEVGFHEIEIYWGKAQIPGSPFEADINPAANANMCSAYGEGLKKCQATIPVQFTVVTNQAEMVKNKHLAVEISDNNKHALDCNFNIIDQMDGSYAATYTVPTPGLYQISITVAKKPIPGSPFNVTAIPPARADLCRAYGSALDPDFTHTTGQTLEFNVDTRQAGASQLNTKLKQPDNSTGRVFMADDGTGVYSVKFDAPQMGRYKIAVRWGDAHIPGSPFLIKVFQGPDASKVRAYGPGLEDGMANGTGEFTIDTKNAGIGTLIVRVHGIKGAFKIDAYAADDTQPRILLGRYDPSLPGIYTISIRWSGEHVPGSPFRVEIMDDDYDDEYDEDFSRAQRRRIAMSENQGPLNEFENQAPVYGQPQGPNFFPFNRSSGIYSTQSLTQRQIDDNFYVQGDGGSGNEKTKKKGFGWFKGSEQKGKSYKKEKKGKSIRVRQSSFGAADGHQYSSRQQHRRVMTAPQQVMYGYPAANPYMYQQYPQYAPQYNPYGYM
ncbi:Filamin-B-like [Oopsacas minuta]|uniref:Filamin-B-like n=1 Tax=Oopsacas minuta TaxID=111878 RepID=A0AAV7KJ22_9METZ|nr:Filamin-B-like [Oopsacas minuta]